MDSSEAKDSPELAAVIDMLEAAGQPELVQVLQLMRGRIGHLELQLKTTQDQRATLQARVAELEGQEVHPVIFDAIRLGTGTRVETATQAAEEIRGLVKEENDRCGEIETLKDGQAELQLDLDNANLALRTAGVERITGCVSGTPHNSGAAILAAIRQQHLAT